LAGLALSCSRYGYLLSQSRWLVSQANDPSYWPGLADQSATSNGHRYFPTLLSAAFAERPVNFFCRAISRLVAAANVR
jgi:hypothetical protein